METLIDFIKPDNIKLPLGVYLKDIKPKSLEILIDYPVKKNLPVQADWVGSLPENLILSGVKIEPDMITVTGGKNVLDKISTVYTEKIPVDDFEESGTLTARLELPQPSVQFASGSPEKVIIHYEVRERGSE